MTSDAISATNQQLNAVVCDDGFNPHFIYYSLQYHKRRLEQAAAKVTVPILNKSNFENFKFTAPDRKVQDEIAAALSIVDDQMDVITRKQAALSALFRTLLHELMTARIRVHNLDLPGLEFASERGQPCPRESLNT